LPSPFSLAHGALLLLCASRVLEHDAFPLLLGRVVLDYTPLPGLACPSTLAHRALPLLLGFDVVLDHALGLVLVELSIYQPLFFLLADTFSWNRSELEKMGQHILGFEGSHQHDPPKRFQYPKTKQGCRPHFQAPKNMPFF
jgi:hypothetical protein